MNIPYILFLKSYRSINRNYTLFAGVKYRIKREDSHYYYTIKDIRLPKNLKGIQYVTIPD